jgi:ATP-dependent DNA ligase
MFYITAPLVHPVSGTAHSIEPAVLEQFTQRRVTGNAAKSLLNDIMNALTPEAQEMLRRIFNRDPKCGVAESTVNKVWPKLVRVFDVMKGDNIEDLDPELAIGRRADAKIDGKRCLAIKEGDIVTFLSSNGKPMYNMEEAIPEILQIPMDFCVLDGEHYDTDWNSSASLSSSSKTKKTSSTWTYRVWDILTKDQWEGRDTKTNFLERDALLNEYIQADFQRVQIVQNYGFVESVEHFHQLCKKAIDEGHEGLMLKIHDYIWERDRGTKWIKYKPVETSDMVITALEPGDPGSKYANVLGRFVCRDGNGNEVRVGGGLSDAQRKEFWEMRGEMINTVIEVKQDVVRDSVKMKARFPRFVRRRLDKSM